MQGKLRPMQKPKSAKPQVEKKVPEKTVPKPAPKKIKKEKKAHSPRTRLYLFSAVAVIVVSLAGAWIGLRKKPVETMPSLELRATASTALPQPDSRSLPPMILEPGSKILKKINAREASLKNKKAPPPVVVAVQAPVKVEPVVHSAAAGIQVPG